MDPVTHAASGLAAGLALRPAFPKVRGFLPFCALAAWIPDIDNLSIFAGPEAYMRLHRGITHSLAFAPVLALLVTLPYAGRDRTRRYLALSLVALALILVHIYLDVITSYGTQVLAPFSDLRLALPLVFIVDPLFTGICLLILLLAAVRPATRRAAGVFCLIWLAVYPGVCLAAKGLAARAARERLGPSAVAHILPEPPSPFCWKIIADSGDAYAMTAVNLIDSRAVYPLESFAKIAPEQLRNLDAADPIFATYAWFAAYPARVQAAPDGLEHFIVRDLRFAPAGSLTRKVLGAEEPPFSLEIDRDPDGKVVRAIFHNRKKSFIRGFAYSD